MYIARCVCLSACLRVFRQAAKAKAEEQAAASAAKEKAGKEEELALFRIEALDDERIAAVRSDETRQMVGRTAI